MKIAFLAKRHSIHTVRWVNALAERGHEVHLISSVHEGGPLHELVRFHTLPVPPPAGFFLNFRALRRLLKDLQPDVLNTHFASGYGTLARLSGFHPNVLSVWGSDVYDFPSKSPLHHKLIRENLKHADWVCSTSEVMAQQTRTILPLERLSVVPFGIDTDAFTPRRSPKPGNTIIIGTVKTLAPKYGIDLLLRSFANLREGLESAHSNIAANLRLLVVGHGPEDANLKQLARELGIGEVTTFAGQVAHEKVPEHLQMLDIYVALSRQESFGVAVLEASACGLPVVVSDVGGLPEVVVNRETGIIVPSEDILTAAAALRDLVTDLPRGETMGRAGRQHVERNYSWTQSVDRLEAVYKTVVGYNS